mmetsp:Transcript_25939/g.70135  ORF Transcript_25939/g.70135 Transcript_25939/m.70135 type:complete len:305 (+) Transcript_25939:291-1205(+)
MLYLAAAVAESPPPMIPAPPFAASSATASSTDFVPLPKLSNSKTPAGPFQMTVLAARIFSRKISMDLGPQSIPSQSAGMPSSAVNTLISCSLVNSLPHAQSTGSVISQPLALAFSTRPGASSAPFLSKRDFPISMPSMTFLKVKAMPPMAMMPSALSMSESITSTLSDTLAPPTIATRGRCTREGSSTFLKASSSFWRRKPLTQGILPAMPTMDACARCAVPNASFTYTSPSLARDAWKDSTSSGVDFVTLQANSGSLHFLDLQPGVWSVRLPSSSAWKRTFSRRMMEPSGALFTAASTTQPTV